MFTIKYKSDGSIKRYKAQLVAKGFTQTYGIDYLETFTPVAKLNTVRVLLSLATNLDWPLQQLDIKNALLYGDLKEELYMDAPPGFGEKFGMRVCKLKRSLYRLKHCRELGLRDLLNLSKVRGTLKDKLIIKCSLDILTKDVVSEINWLKTSLSSTLEIKDLGSLRYFLGMEVARSKKEIVVSQQKYILDLLKETGMNSYRLAYTPINPN